MTRNLNKVSRCLTKMNSNNLGPAHKDVLTFFAVEWRKTERAKVSSAQDANSKLAPFA